MLSIDPRDFRAEGGGVAAKSAEIDPGMSCGSIVIAGPAPLPPPPPTPSRRDDWCNLDLCMCVRVQLHR